MNDNNLLQEKAREVKEAFDMFDKDKDCKIDHKEFTNVMKALGYNLSEKEMWLITKINKAKLFLPTKYQTTLKSPSMK